ncbi:heat-inducible transcriptional repressor HrcA [Chitinibacteraceae bacterium HSL-7]
MLNSRAQLLLNTLVEHYIADGHPLGSKALLQLAGLDVSSATVRNVLCDLEELGFIASPHTSAGRIPTQLGYRFFVDRFMAAAPQKLITPIQNDLPLGETPQQAVAAASQLLSQLTQFAGVVQLPRAQETRLKQVEFIGLSDRRVLMILVTADGDVQNRILKADRDFAPAELTEAANFINAHCAGRTLAALSRVVETEASRLRAEIVLLLNAAISNPTLPSEVLVRGEHQLLGSRELAANMPRLKELFELLDGKVALLQLLERGTEASGVQIYIGTESGLAPLDECSVVTAPYYVDGEVVGTLGVIGPTRMAYERVIPIVDVTARLLSNTLARF